MEQNSRNEAELGGRVLTAPAFSHENHGTRFYRFLLHVPRLSGQADTLPILVTGSQAELVIPGRDLHILGQLRSFNNRSGQGSRLVLTVYAQTVEPGVEPCNHIFLTGSLCKLPILRRTPLGRSICDLMLAVPRRYGRADYLPVIAWGQLANLLSHRSVGDWISLEGRIQSRLYTKVTDDGPQERTAYEVSMMHLLEEQTES